jgi:hypothetical protein
LGDEVEGGYTLEKVLLVVGALQGRMKQKMARVQQKSIAPGKNKSLKHQTQRVTKGLLNFALVG